MSDLNKNQFELALAKLDELDEIVGIYESVKGGEFCPWNESYPTAADAKGDIEAGTLYLLKNGGAIIGCISLEPFSADDDLCWRVCDGKHREIVRVAIAPKYQGRGYANIMVKMLIGEMRHIGVSSLHLLVAKANPPALNTYKSNGFEIIGECYRYDTDFFIGELVL